jgi:hypothetical protein
LSDACAKRPIEPFFEVFSFLYHYAKNSLAKKIKKTLYLVDSTPHQLKTYGYEWAKSAHRTIGLKSHIVYDLSNNLPCYINITDANIIDTKEALKVPLEEKTIYCFDRAYNEYQCWKDLKKKEITFVTRIKSNVPYQIIARRKCKKKNIDDKKNAAQKSNLTGKEKHIRQI